MTFLLRWLLVLVSIFWGPCAVAQLTIEDVMRGAVSPKEQTPRRASPSVPPDLYNPDRQSYKRKLDDTDEFETRDEDILQQSESPPPRGGYYPPPRPSYGDGGGSRQCGPARDSMCRGRPPQRGASCNCCYDSYGVPSCSWGRGAAPTAVTHARCTTASSGAFSYSASCQRQPPLNHWIVRRETLTKASYNRAGYEVRAARQGAGDTVRTIQYAVTCNPPARGERVVAGPYKEPRGKDRHDQSGIRSSVRNHVSNKLREGLRACCREIGSNGSDNYSYCSYNPLKGR